MSKIPVRVRSRSRSESRSRSRSRANSTLVLTENEEVDIGGSVNYLETVPTENTNKLELDINNNNSIPWEITPPSSPPLLKKPPTVTLSILPAFKIFQLPYDTPPLIAFIPSSKFPIITILKLKRTRMLSSTFPPPASTPPLTISKSQTMSLVQLQKSQDDVTDESFFSNFHFSFDTNYEKEVLGGVLDWFYKGGRFLGNFLEYESSPTDTITYNGYKITITGRKLLLRSVNVNCQFGDEVHAEGSRCCGKNRVRVEVELRDCSTMTHPIKTTTSTMFKLGLEIRDELEEMELNSVVIVVPDGVCSNGVEWEWGDKTNMVIVWCP